MKAHLGEDGTEQFSVHVLVDGKTIQVKPIHDPFIRSTVIHNISRWDLFKALFEKQFSVRVEVHVDGSEGANRAIMTLDPEQLQRDTEEILEERRISREANGVMGFYAAEIDTHRERR